MNSLQKGNCITAIAGDYRRRYSIITLIEFGVTVAVPLLINACTCKITRAPLREFPQCVISRSKFVQDGCAGRKSRCIAGSFAFVPDLRCCAVRRQSSDPEVDYDAVS